MIDVKRMATDTTYRRIVREDLEDMEGTPRADLLNMIQAIEFALEMTLDAARNDNDVTGPAALALDRLNDLYLLLSPEEPQDEQQALPL